MSPTGRWNVKIVAFAGGEEPEVTTINLPADSEVEATMMGEMMGHPLATRVSELADGLSSVAQVDVRPSPWQEPQ